MNVESVMKEIGDKADVIVGLRVFRYPPDKAVNKSFIVGLPNEVRYDETYGRGSDAMTFPAWVLVEMTNYRSAVTQVVKYLNGSGAQSIKAAVDSTTTNTYVSCDTVTVTTAETGSYTWAGVDMLGAEFAITVTGSGS